MNRDRAKRDENRVKVIDHQLEAGCQICGYNEHHAGLCFHHINPEEKKFGLKWQGLNRSWEALEIEILKCAVLCHNCHHILHYEEKK